jgi:hypothetical protein
MPPGADEARRDCGRVAKGKSRVVASPDCSQYGSAINYRLVVKGTTLIARFQTWNGEAKAALACESDFLCFDRFYFA